MRRKAITLGELLLVFVIMGVVASMTIITAKPQEKNLKFVYSRTLSTLSTAFYNASMNLPTYLTSGEGATHMDGSFPTRPYEFCMMLTEYINTSAGSSNNCDAAKTGTLIVNQTGANINSWLNSHEPNFIASNGVKYWIATTNADNTFATAKFSSSTGSADFEIRYYVVVVDLNGDMGPNTVIWRPKRAADRVAFIVTEDADVIPIGYPEVDVRYLTAQVVYATTSGIELEDQNTSPEMSYYLAKRTAWASNTGAANIYAKADNPLTLSFYSNQASVPGNKNDAITSTSPFYLNYANAEEGSGDAAQKYSFTNDNLVKYDENNCSSDGAFDPDACYVNLPDFY